MSTESVKCSTWMHLKNCSFPRQTLNVMVFKVYTPTSNAEEAKPEWFYEDLQDLLELTPKK